MSNVVGFYMDESRCFACGNNYSHNGYEPLTPCPYCKKKNEDKARLRNKNKRQKVEIRRSKP